MRYRIGELSVGQVLDVSFNVFKDNIKELLLVGLMIFGVLAVITAAVSFFVLYPMISEMESLSQSGLQPTPANVFSMFLPLIVGALGLGLLWWIALTLAEGAITFSVAGAYLENPVPAKEAVRYALSQWWPLIKTSLFVMLRLLLVLIAGGAIVGLMVFALGEGGAAALLGVLFFLALFGFLAFLFIRYLLSLKVVVLEGVDGREAIGRSATLMKKTYGRAFLLLFLMGVAGNIAGSAANFIPFLPVAILISMAVQLAVYIYTSSMWTVFYFSNRCKHEQFDLMVLSQQAGVEGVE